MTDVTDIRKGQFDKLPGVTYKFRWHDYDAGEDYTYYITINHIIIEDVYLPYELFINTKNTRHYAWMIALTRMISGDFRQQRALDAARELQEIFDPRGSQTVGKEEIKSLPAAIGIVIERHLAYLAEQSEILTTNIKEQKS